MPPFKKNQPVKEIAEQPLASIQPFTVTTSSDYSQFNLVPAVSKPNPKGQAKKRKASLVHHENGKRFEFVDEVIATIGADKTLQFAFSEKGFAVGTKLPGCDADFPLCKNGNVWAVYSKDLGVEAIELFSLDFTGKSTISFQDVVYLNSGDMTVAFFPVVQEEPQTDGLDVPTDTDAGTDDAIGGRLAPTNTVSPDMDEPESFLEVLAATSTDDESDTPHEAYRD